MRESTTSAALRNILASAADTPPTRPIPLTSKQTNTQSSTPKMQKDAIDLHKVDASVAKTDSPAAPSSAALAAKDRIQRAVDAAKARNGSSARLNNVTQRRN